MEEKISYQKNITVYGHYDIAVLGGGPSGVCAAIEAARAGKKVLLVEASGMLGGMAVTGLVGPYMTSYDRDGEKPTVGGLYREIVERLLKCDGAIAPEQVDCGSIYTAYINEYHRHVTPIDSFKLQLVLDDMVKEAGVETLFYTRASDCVVDGGNIKYVILSALEGLLAVRAKIYIDCTGNADIAAFSGVPTYKGDEINGVPQPATLMFEVSGADDERYTKVNYPVKAYRTPVAGRYKVNHYHVYNVDAANSKSMTAAHIEARKQVLDAYSVLKDKTPGFEKAELTQVATVLGVRESRHINGIYKITVDDVNSGKKYEDRIAVYGFGMDVHSRNPQEHGNFKIEIAKRYYIPFSSMLPLNCNNLIVAGKTISCESQAAGGLRCMPCAMAMGQAAGAAAGIAVANELEPKKINVSDLQNTLLSHNAIID